ncbi:MAG: RnfABCDGE type electron transport complex subunit A [Deltaproteobacteria bacterium]
MSNELTWYMILLSSILINNIVLIRFLALCSFFGVSNEIETSIGMGMAVIFVMTLASASTWILWYALLLPLHLEYLRTAVFILVIAGLVQFVEMYMKKALKSLYNAMGIYLPLITTNCAVLAIALLNIDYGLGFVNSIIYTVGVAVGYTVAIILFAAIKERIALSTTIPASFRGHPIGFITAALMSMAFLGFSHLFGL